MKMELRRIADLLEEIDWREIKYPRVLGWQTEVEIVQVRKVKNKDVYVIEFAGSGTGNFQLLISKKDLKNLYEKLKKIFGD